MKTKKTSKRVLELMKKIKTRKALIREARRLFSGKDVVITIPIRCHILWEQDDYPSFDDGSDFDTWCVAPSQRAVKSCEEWQIFQDRINAVLERSNELADEEGIERSLYWDGIMCDADAIPH